MASLLPQSMVGAPVATALLVATVAVSLVALKLRPQWMAIGVFRPQALVPRRQWGTLVSNAFLHADLVHLAMNLFTFWAFAFPLERRIGSLRFAALYAVGMAVSDAGTWLRHRHDPHYQTLGASGAVMAVLFASVVYFPTASLMVFPLPVPLPAPVFAVLYLAYTWHAARQPASGINHDAHFGGALAGLAFVTLSDPSALGQAVRQVQAWGG